MEKGEEKEENFLTEKKTRFDIDFNITFSAMRLNDISYLSSKQTKDLMFAISDYVWGRDSFESLMKQLDTATKIVFLNMSSEIDVN